MPGEQVEDALKAAQDLHKQGISTIVTHLGENVITELETQTVKEHYLKVLEQVHSAGLDTHISVKLTELGLDQNHDLCYSNLKQLIQTAGRFGNYVWIDMEGSIYTAGTLQIYERARKEFENVGVCLQSYLYRTAEDLDKLLAVSPGIRLVKGAYAEPASVAFEKKSDNDENYFKLARTMLLLAKDGRLVAGFGTHDQNLIGRIRELSENMSVSSSAYEVQMLYGIRRQDQLRLVREGARVRVLISYGTYWFPWYMRRLAERPANLLFVLRNLW